MQNPFKKILRLGWLPAFFGLVLIGTGSSRAQMIDQNDNGISDIWEWVYNAAAIDPAADTDGDGFSNLQEAMAGTNPFDTTSYPKISGAVYTNASFSVNIPGVLGKRYELQSVPFLGSTNWINETSLVARVAGPMTLAAPADLTTKYFRIALSDTNSDSGALNDWEKYQLGLDPFNPYSNGQRDANGNALTDYQYVTNQLAQQNIVTLSATDPVTIQPDPGQSATDLGVFTINRSGFPLNAITVSLVPGGTGAGIATAGLDYSALPVIVTFPAGVSSQTVNVTPLANTNLMVPVIAPLKIVTGNGNTLGTPTKSGILINPSATPNGKGLLGEYFTNSSTTFTNAKNFNPTNLFLTRIDPVIDFNWTNGTSPNLSNGLYSVRWTGQVQPQYSETYFFGVRSDDGVRLWVNDQLLINKWQTQGATDWTNAITLQGGSRYNLRLEYLQAGGTGRAQLYWFSPNQAKQVIPNSRLYSTNSSGGSSNAPAVVTSALSAVAFLGQPFSFTVTGANSPLGFTASGLPPGLSFNNTNGAIVGMPSLAGDYQVTLTASNLIGVGASVVSIQVLNTGSSVVQEIWTSINGSSVTDIPTDAPANITNVLGSLEGITDYGDNYGERVRGFFTAPSSGNYYLLIAGGDAAQLWISDDIEPVKKVLRAWVTPTNNPTAPGRMGTSTRQWNLQVNQRSGWLALTAGQKYYIEILHKAAAGTGDNWSVAWLLDPTGTNTTPAGVVPGYVSSRYYPPLSVNIPGTLYSANLLALPGTVSTGVGTATLRLSADQTTGGLEIPDQQSGRDSYWSCHQRRPVSEQSGPVDLRYFCGPPAG